VNRTRITGMGALLAAMFLGSSAKAAEPWYHEGFQFRGAVGAGFLSDSETSNVNLHGGAGAFEVYIGGTPARGLVIGGFINDAIVIDPTVSVPNVSVSTDSNTSLSLVTIGPYIDFYPNPREGFHIIGTLGFADLSLSYNDENVSSTHSTTGFAIGGGIGYDWWVSPYWSLGILARLTFASMSENSVTDNLVAPTLLFSFSYN
jgi:hypothetical protein